MHNSVYGLAVIRLLVTCVLMTQAIASSANDTLKCESNVQLSFGMVPVTSASLTDIWASRINRAVRKRACVELSFSSAVDFKGYIKKAHQGDFDVLAVPAHMASYLIGTAGFKPIASLVWESRYLYVVPSDSPVASLADIGGRRLALSDPLSEVSILAAKDVSAHHSDIHFQHYKNFNQVFRALMNSGADVGVVLSPFYEGYKKRTESSVRVIHSAPFPNHGMLIAAPHVAKSDSLELFNGLAALDPSADLFWESFESVSALQVKKLHQDQRASVEALKLLITQN